MTSEMGLRERKKQATRAALSQAAWSLMVEKGLDAATPEAIAEAADVSARTFRNYFASREEAILDWMMQRGMALAEAIRARPAGEPVWDSLIALLPEIVEGLIGPSRDMVVLMRMLKCEPGLMAQHLVVFERGHKAMEQVIAERSGANPGALAPRLLGAAVAAVLKETIEIWATGDTDAPLSDLIRESLVLLRAGLPLDATPTT